MSRPMSATWGHKNAALLLFFSVVLLMAFGKHEVVASTIEQKIELILSAAEKQSGDRANHAFVLKMCSEAVALNPNNLDTYYRCGLILGRMGDYVSSIRSLSIVIKNDERNKTLKYPAARKFRGDCFMGLGSMQNAVEDYSFILRKHPKSSSNGKIWFYMAEALALMNRKDLALNAITQGCATGSHWCNKMKALEEKIIRGESITPHQPLSN